MSKRNKWARKRAHQAKDTLIRHRDSSKAFKIQTSRRERRSIRQQCHTAINAEWADTIDIYHQVPGEWDWFLGAYTSYGELEPYRPRRPENRIWLTTEEEHHLPRWLQFLIAKNRAPKNKFFGPGWHNYRAPQLFLKKELGQILEDIVYNNHLHQLNLRISSSHIQYYEDEVIDNSKYTKKILVRPVGPQAPILVGYAIDSYLAKINAANTRRPTENDAKYWYQTRWGGVYNRHLNPDYHPEWMAALQEYCREYTRNW